MWPDTFDTTTPHIKLLRSCPKSFYVYGQAYEDLPRVSSHVHGRSLGTRTPSYMLHFGWVIALFLSSRINHLSETLGNVEYFNHATLWLCAELMLHLGSPAGAVK